jgi:hypothetical protein
VAQALRRADISFVASPSHLETGWLRAGMK